MAMTKYRKNDSRLKKTIRSEARKVTKRAIMTASESKYNDVYSAPPIDFSGAILALTNTTQGTSDVTRIGDSITPSKLWFRMLVNGETSSGMVRLILFRWTDFGAPIVSNILQSTGSSYSVSSPYVHDRQSQQYTILYDQTKPVSNNGGSELIMFNYTRKLAAKKIQYLLAGTNGGKNELYAIIITDTDFANSPTVALSSRFEFKET